MFYGWDEGPSAGDGAWGMGNGKRRVGRGLAWGWDGVDEGVWVVRLMWFLGSVELDDMLC